MRTKYGPYTQKLPEQTILAISWIMLSMLHAFQFRTILILMIAREMFEEHQLILGQLQDSGYRRRLSSDECIWSGPSWMQEKSCLLGVGKYGSDKSLENFLRVSLGVRDMTWQDAISELKFAKQSTATTSHVKDIYRWLLQNLDMHSSADMLR